MEQIAQLLLEPEVPIVSTGYETNSVNSALILLGLSITIRLLLRSLNLVMILIEDIG